MVGALHEAPAVHGGFRTKPTGSLRSMTVLEASKASSLRSQSPIPKIGHLQTAHPQELSPMEARRIFSSLPASRPSLSFQHSMEPSPDGTQLSASPLAAILHLLTQSLLFE